MDAAGDADRNDPHDLRRFLAAQEGAYGEALAELREGRKRSHWMWFVFPQVDGLGRSDTASFFSVKSVEEARSYLAHPVLGARLRECAEALLALEGRSASEIFGHPDDLKLRSSMTLFASVSGAGGAFARVLDRYFGGERCDRTLRVLERPGRGAQGGGAPGPVPGR